MSADIHDPHAGTPPWRMLLWGSIPVLLAIPAIGMLFSSEVDWSLFDFALAAGLLSGTALVAEIIMRNARSFPLKALLIALLLAALAFVWVELAVGVVGSPIAGS